MKYHSPPGLGGEEVIPYTYISTGFLLEMTTIKSEIRNLKYINSTLIFCLTVIFFAGCSNKTLKYSLGFKNEGKIGVVMSPIKLNSYGETVGLGDQQVLPGQYVSEMIFYHPPAGEIGVEWRTLPGDVTNKVAVTINLPKEFTRDCGSSIDLQIFPEEHKVTVEYEILDLKTGRIRTIQQ